MTAAKARETAFKTVHTTYEEGINNMIKVIDETIENHAKKGELSISFDLKELIVNHIKLSNHTIYETVREYIKTQYEEKGFKVYNTRFGYIPTYTTIDW
jgi:hypothetical protein